MRLSSAVLAVVLVLAARSASAQAPGSTHDAEARALFDAGAAAFDEGRFDEAHERFRRAHELSGRPELLYNIGAAADRGGHEQAAIEAYEAYVAALPDAENRSYVDARVAVLRARLADAPATPDPREVTPPEDGAGPPEASPETPASTASSADPTAAIVLFVGAAATGAAAIATGAVGLSIRSELDAACPMRVCTDPALRTRGDEMAAYGLATDVLAGASLALAAAGLVAALLMPSSESDAVSIGPGGARFRF